MLLSNNKYSNAERYSVFILLLAYPNYTSMLLIVVSELAKFDSKFRFSTICGEYITI